MCFVTPTDETRTLLCHNGTVIYSVTGSRAWRDLRRNLCIMSGKIYLLTFCVISSATAMAIGRAVWRKVETGEEECLID